MTKEVARSKEDKLVPVDPKTRKPFTDAQINLISRTVARGSTRDELMLFLVVANKSGLDPFSRQIHFVKRKTKQGEVGVIQTGIDGYRAIAERTKQYAGSDDIVYDKEQGVSTGYSEGQDHPVKATSTVYRIVKGMRVAFTASARWKEYVPSAPNDFMWKKMPFLMLGKVAESLALRKAFPNDLSGIYVEEETERIGSVVDVAAGPSPSPAAPEEPKKKTVGALANLYATAREFGAKPGQEDVFIQEMLEINIEWDELSDADIARFRTQLMANLAKNGAAK